MKKIIYFIKIFDNERFMNDFLDGKIYMNRLSYFRFVDDNSDNNRADQKEGLSGWWQPEQIALEVNGRKMTNFAAPIEIRSNKSDNLHVFCLFAGATNIENTVDDNKIATNKTSKVKDDLSVSAECANLGRYYVLVHNTSAFIDRMVAATKKHNYKGSAGLVEYYNPIDFSGDFGDRSVFYKPNNFAHQKEYRFVIDAGTIGEDALTLNIGNIRDIANIIDSLDIKVEFQ